MPRPWQRLSVHAFTCLLALASPQASAAAGTNVGGRSKSITLGQQDLAVIRQIACRDYGVSVESIAPALRWTYGGQFKPVLEVALRCAPHGSVNGLPSHYNVECRRDDDRLARDWQCHGWRAILVPTQIGEISVEPGPYSDDFATRTVHAALDTTRFQRQAHDALPSGCRLASNWDGQGEEVAELSCASGHRFLFSFWCPQGDCPRLLTATSPGE